MTLFEAEHARDPRPNLFVSFYDSSSQFHTMRAMRHRESLFEAVWVNADGGFLRIIEFGS
jgi:hypothetical protein